MEELDILRRRIDRERKARMEAESLLEQKALELYSKNEELNKLNEQLEMLVVERTAAFETSQSRFSQLIANLHQGVMVADENGKIILVNEALCNLFGCTKDLNKIVGSDAIAMMEESSGGFIDPEGFIERQKEIMNARIPVISEELTLTSSLVVERDFIPVNLGEKVLGYMWTYRDVTEDRNHEYKLRMSEEKYRGIIENMELGLIEVDRNGIIRRAYNRFCEMVGYEENELIGHDASIILLAPEYIPVLEKQHEERKAGKAGVYECEILRKDGSRVWVLISGTPIFNSEGELDGSVGIHYDISKQKALQKALENARFVAEAAQESEKQFLANMSHEMRTPLNAIIGMSHLLADTDVSAEQNEYLSLLRTSADILQNLISDVLDLSKIRSGKLEISKKPFDLNAIIENIARSFAIRLENTPVQVYHHTDSQLSTLLLGDDLLLNQVIMNLMSNAAKFTASGRIDLSVLLLERQDSKILVQISVSDTGIGVPADKQGLIFQSFRQVDSDIKRKYGGTGLGLTITKQILELQDGNIRLSSTPGKGSRFTVELSYEDTGIEIVKEAKPARLNEFATFNHAKILIVEDNYMNRKYVTSLLKKWGIQHDIAVDGREGVQKCKENQYDLIFMDVQMPEMDGYEATAAIRRDHNINQETTIIALTASALVSQKDHAFDVGMNDYLSKPYTPMQLREKLEKHLTGKENDLPLPGAADFLQEFYDGDIGYAAEMFDIFIEEIYPQFSDLFRLCNEKKWSELAKLAHKLKPTTQMVGLSDISSLLFQIENFSLKPDAEKLPIHELTLESIVQIDAQMPMVRAQHKHLLSLLA